MAAANPKPTIVFDLGGVVLHWQPAQLLMKHLPDRLKTIEQAQDLAAEFFESFRPGGSWAEFDRGVLSSDAVARQIASRTALPIEAVAAVMQGVLAHLTLRPDTTALLNQLKDVGHRMVFLSNMPATYIEHVQRQLDSLGVFERGIFSSDVRLVKPEAAVFELALRTFDCRAGDCVLLDDNAANVEAARHAGWQALQFVDAVQASRDLVGLGLLPDR